MKRRKLSSAFIALALACALAACSDSKQAREETPAATPAPSSAAAGPVETTTATPTPDASAATTPTPAPTPLPATPAANEVRAAIERVYKGAVAPDSRPGSIVVGDFNGDGFEDLAVRVRPEASRLADLNDDLANWIITDPRKVLRPDPRLFDPHQNVQKLPPPERPRVEAADSLLIVLHGYKETGWRNPEASQTFLLKGAGGADLRAQLRADARAATPARSNPPRLMGDVIRETMQGEQGFLYWNGATYGWFHP
jgi:FG-GAP repeat